MHDTEGYARWKRGAGPLLAAGLLSAALLSCARAESVQVSASAPRPSSPPSEPTQSFQGSVAAIDPDAGEMVVAVQIVWAPVLKADPHERRVRVDAHTRWEPVPGDIALLHLGDEVQVQAVDASDGTWHASEVQLLDID